MIEFQKKDIHSISDLWKNTHKLINKVKNTKRPILITKNGKRTAAILPLNLYKELQEEIELFKGIIKSQKDIKEGRVVSNEDVLKMLEKYYK